MIDWLGPSFTKNVPMIEAMMQTPPMASGKVIIRIRVSSQPALAKEIAARTIVATVVTA